MGQAVVSGLVTGSLYALAAFGLVLIFKTSGVVNFAQGELAMFNTFIAYTIMRVSGIPYFAAFCLTVAIAALLGLLIHRAVVKPLGRASPLSAMIATLGLIMIVNGLAGNIFGFETKRFPKVVTGENLSIGGVSVEPNSIFILVLTAAITAGFYLYFRKAMGGLAIRAVAQDPEAATLMGISVERVVTNTWMMAAMLSAVAGMLIAPTTFLDLAMMSSVHMNSFSSAVLGGFNTFEGPLTGGLLLGVMENLFGRYVSLTWKTVFTFGLIILMLVIRPHGLFGKSHRKKV